MPPKFNMVFYCDTCESIGQKPVKGGLCGSCRDLKNQSKMSKLKNCRSDAIVQVETEKKRSCEDSKTRCESFGCNGRFRNVQGIIRMYCNAHESRRDFAIKIIAYAKPREQKIDNYLRDMMATIKSSNCYYGCSATTFDGGLNSCGKCYIDYDNIIAQYIQRRSLVYLCAPLLKLIGDYYGR